MFPKSHYDWLDCNFTKLLDRLGIPKDGNQGLIVCHGDKCYSYRSIWEKHKIPFEHGVAVYLLSYVRPYSKEVRDTTKGWVAPDDWVIENYCGKHRFKDVIEALEKPAESPPSQIKDGPVLSGPVLFSKGTDFC